MRKRRRLAFRPAILSLIAAALLLVTCGPSPATVTPTAGLTPTNGAAPFALVQPTPPPAPVPRPTSLPEAEVSEIVDGDTIKVLIGGREETVRYIGIDTPETRGPEGEEPYAAEATAANRRLVEGEKVGLQKDVSETDRYGRLLRYVWVGDVMVNAELVRLGLAMASTYPPDVEYEHLFLELQQQAREAGRGLWAGLAEPTAAPLPTQPPAVETPAPELPTAEPGGECDPSYPDVCIPPPPPDLDCGDIPYRNFRVLPPDPHGFDRDSDGIGCEG